MKRLCQFIYLIFGLAFYLIAINACSGDHSKDSVTVLKNNTTAVKVGGPFKNNDFTYYGIPKSVSPADTSPGWQQSGQKILLTGIVYMADGITPAPDVLLYYYHTNTGGRYIHKPEESRSMPPNEQGQTHGYIRGWIKTDSTGHYFIYTVMPGTYPTRDAPAHVHATIKEPGDINEYYIDDFVFDDDKLLTSEYRKKMENRCGSGVLRMVTKNDLLIGERNIYLGLNIPGYPRKSGAAMKSGRNIGEDVFSFIPFHAWGPDKGTRTCPVCKYGRYEGILYFVGNHPDWKEIKQWLTFLEAESTKRKKYLKAYFVYGNEKDYNKRNRDLELEKIGGELKLENVALTHVPSLSDHESEIDLNNIDPGTENTFLIYKRSKVIAGFVNLKPESENFQLITKVLDNSINEYFDLPQN